MCFFSACIIENDSIKVSGPSPKPENKVEVNKKDTTESSVPKPDTNPQKGQDDDTVKSSTSSPDPKNEEPFSNQSEIIAIGDIHGDFPALISALQMGEVIDNNYRWTGGEKTVVLTGDMLDRGPDDRQVLDYLLDLQNEARISGGQVVMLIGNHEIFNLRLYSGYVNSATWSDFQDFPFDPDDPALLNFSPTERGRWTAFKPGQHYALELAKFPCIYVQDSVLFVHGGIFPDFIRYGISKINDEMKAWMEGKTSEPYKWSESPIFWDRTYSSSSYNPTPMQCEQLDTALSLAAAKMLVVGHTVHLEGMTSACGGKVWRIDVGLSAYYGGTTSVLRIHGGKTNILK